MNLRDQLALTAGVLRGHPLRTALSMLGVGIGIASVVLLTSLGEGTRRHVLGQFTQFGTNLLAIHPGKTETFGIPGVFGGTTHKLTLEDAEALRRVPGVTEVIPVAMAQARVEADGRGRSVYVYGVTAEAPGVWKFGVRQGSFLPSGDPRRGGAVAVLGPKLARELFGAGNPLGGTVRIAGARCRVVGVMAPKGRMLGFDIDDAAYVPVATAMRIFNLEELMEVDVTFRREGDATAVVEALTRTLARRHGGREDFTIVTQDAMLAIFGRILRLVTAAVAAIGGVSLVVGAVGVLTLMWIAVAERTAEVGLLRAMGATRGQIRRLFLGEAAALTGAGGAGGLLAGLGLAALLRALLPGLPVETPPLYAAVALVVSVAVGLAAGVAPAQHAASLDPTEALRAE